MGRGLLVWLLIMLVETAHGVLRGVFLVPRIGADAAGRIGWPMAALVVLAIATLTLRWTGLAGRASLLRLGIAWAVLTVLFELLIGALRGLDSEELLAALNPLTGSVAWTAAVMLLAPLAASWLRGAR